jgi:hypothetical protein
MRAYVSHLENGQPSTMLSESQNSGYSCSDNPSIAYSGTSKAVMIQVRWAETDLPDFPTHPIVPGAEPTAKVRIPIELRTPHIEGRLEAGAAPITIPPDYGFEVVDYAVSGSFASTSTTTSTRRTSGSSVPTSGFPQETGVYPPDETDGSNGGLSTGAKAGIGVGVSLGVLLIAGIVGFFLWRRRKQRLAAAQGQQQPYVPPPGGMSELGAGGFPKGPAELSSQGQIVPGMAGGPAISTPGTGYHTVSPNTPAISGFYTTSPTVVGSELGTSSPRPPELETIHPAQYQELPGQSHPPPAELGPAPVSMPELPAPTYYPQGAQQPYNWTPQDSPPIQNSPDTGVAVMPQLGSGRHTPTPTSPIPSPPVQQQQQQQQPIFMHPAQPSEQEPSPAELSHLMDQHSQLEARKQRLLQLQQIEDEQAALQQKIQSMQGGHQGGPGGPSGSGAAS